MTYDHSNKIGNKGDLVKHFALTTAIRHIAKGRRSFSYLDVHSGRSEYDLPEKGEWKTGVGRFAEVCHGYESLNESLQYFCDVQSIDKIHQSKKYWGSSRIILNVLNDIQIEQTQITLCDTNPAVFEDLKVRFQNAPSVNVCCADGYEMVYQNDSIDLIFIDPPDISEHYPPFQKVIRYCISKDISFISWNPLHGNVLKQRMSHNCLSIQKLAKNRKVPSITVRWSKGWSGQMCGCQMLFSLTKGNEIVTACHDLVGMMGWQLVKE